MELPLEPNTLYVLDFDETVASFEGIDKQWWQDKFQEYYNKHNDYDFADAESLRDWKHHITYIQPIPTHIDQLGLERIQQYANGQSGSNLVILTARDSDLKHLTIKQLEVLLPEHDIDIIFCDGGHKGEKLSEYLAIRDLGYSNIIFVDDNISNIQSMKEIYGLAQCYYIN